MLKLDENHPGLSCQEGITRGKLLALQSVATVGRCDEEAFGSASLIGVAQHRGRVEATFAPPGWDGLRIRAVWAPAPVGEGVDLEVQIQAATAEVLEQVEVGILSEWDDEVSDPHTRRVEPRDVRSAALSYDGRESLRTLQDLTTLPVPQSSPHTLPPRFFAPPEFGSDLGYAEMVQPNDCARRISREPAGWPSEPRMSLSTRYALFGHDLEKGVVLRARLRGLWIPSHSPVSEIQRLYEEFLREPPSLGL
jgi:hypothetical protein